jgi:uncharacterized ferritin-like protein (DUF455 family)
MTRSFWPRRAVLETVETLAFLQRSAAHLLAGWLAKVPDLEDKMVLGCLQYTHMESTTGLRRQLHAASQPFGAWTSSLHQGIKNYATALETTANKPGGLAAALADLHTRVREQADAALQGTDPVMDAYLREQLVQASRAAEQQLSWCAAHQATGRQASLEESWAARQQGEVLAENAWLSSPADRVPRPARAEGLKLAIPGALSSHATHANNPAHSRQTFHRMFDEEITTMELFGRSSYEHPALPEAFHLNMARQVSDESRHARACLEVLTDLGGTYGERPCSVGVYTFHYQYGPCEPGSERELLWRLLLRSAFEEALSLDGFVLQIKKRQHHQQEQIARVLEAIMADEIFHVRNGWHWATHLCGGDRERVNRELAEAHAWDLTETERIRRAYVMENPDEALAELEFVKQRNDIVPASYPFSLDIRINRAARQAAGMSEAEMDQVVSWGYAYP